MLMKDGYEDVDDGDDEGGYEGGDEDGYQGITSN